MLILKSSANEGELREVFDVIIPSLVQFYIHRDEEGAAVEELIPILEEFAVKNEVGDKDKALIYFSISKVLANKGDLGEAVEEIDKAISFQPDEKAYASAKQVLIKKISSQ